MLEVLSKFLNCLITTIIGIYLVKIITKKNINFLGLRNIFIIIVMSIITTCLQNMNYAGIHTILIFCINIIAYKKIFNLNFDESIISSGLSMLLMFLGEFILSIMIILIFSMEEIKDNIVLNIFLNIIIGIITIWISNIKPIKEKLQKFHNTIKSRKTIVDILFILLTIIIVAFFAYELLKDFNLNYNYISNFLIFIIVSVLVSMFINSRNNYSQLSDEYDTLFSYIQNFEEWIEKEQVNRHEYKNQLAVLRSLTKEENLINKINEILEDNINIKGDVIHKLKELPKGGLKGLMYYKVAIAQKHKLNIEVDVSLQKKSNLKKLSESQIKVLCNLIGIYFDNAIEAAVETRKKLLSLEVYELKDKTKIVISNTFKYSEEFSNRNERGVTTKGKGHGNGLYYANNIISKNKWIESTQEIIKNYYIQTITIKKD